ncbi:MAG: hypothetical protein N4A72_22020 [Bacteroidales bacterium]|jgi:hypothetical protein|nr:hypothetical protein [Bacteroidales bacterium]
MSVKTEVWVRGVVKHLNQREEGTWLKGVTNYSKYAENNVLHLTDSTIDPEVLINNTTYPIPIQDFEDSDIPISLDKFVTKQTRITDDELEACTYDKIGLAKDKHAKAIHKSKYAKALHALCPAKHTDKTPVIICSGEELPDGRRRLVRADVIRLRAAYDEAGFDKEGRRLVLTSEHCTDLLLEDKEFKAQYAKHITGKITTMYGFDIYDTVSSPYITVATKVKKAFKAIPASGDQQASVSFIVDGVCYAKGTTRMYYSPAKTNPGTQANFINFRHRYIALPIKQEGIGAIV